MNKCGSLKERKRLQHSLLLPAKTHDIISVQAKWSIHQVEKEKNASCDSEVTQDQTFSCLKSNTSKTFITPHQIFLCFYASKSH